jgi:hypothetical protein
MTKVPSLLYTQVLHALQRKRRSPSDDLDRRGACRRAVGGGRPEAEVGENLLNHLRLLDECDEK